MNEELIEDIYYTLIGELVPEAEVPGVENFFAPGRECFQLYEELYDACERIRERLGVPDEDPDIEIILSDSAEIQRILGMEMFRLGLRFRE